MSRRGDHRSSARLAALQRLATTLRHEELGRACRETDERAEAERGAFDRNRLAEQALDEVFAQKQLCLDRMTLAGMSLEASEVQLAASRTALDEARHEETVALAGYGEAEQRLRWIAAHARDLRRRHLEKREEQATAEAVLLRGNRRSPR